MCYVGIFIVGLGLDVLDMVVLVLLLLFLFFWHCYLVYVDIEIWLALSNQLISFTLWEAYCDDKQALDLKNRNDVFHFKDKLIGPTTFANLMLDPRYDGLSYSS